MSDETTMEEETTDTTESTEKAATPEEPAELIMCYISKQMVPINETVEVSYGANKKFRVLPRFVKY